jgi:glycosyltransferase involved in cell wall biosynthesis
MTDTHEALKTTTLTVHMASLNTRASTELCVRALRQHGGLPFELVVGDSGSTDGSLDLLRRFEARGWLRLEVERGFTHSAWLDRWRGSCTTDLAVFLDSDLEIRRPGLLRELVDEARRSGAALVCAELLPEARDFVEPVGGKTLRGAVRPAPWLLLVDVEQTRDIDAGFAFHAEPSDEVSEGLIGYDVGARFYHEAIRRGLQCVEMPEGFRRGYRHYEGLSWIPLRGRRGLRKLQALAEVEWRLRRMRIRQRGLR